MRASINEIAELACDVRNGIEQGALSPKELTRPYLDLCPDRFREVQVLRRKGLDDFPRGWCQVTTAFIRYLLEEGEPLNGLLLRQPHTVLDVGGAALYGQTTIVDITGDQMHPDIPPVYVGPLQMPWQASMLEAATPIPDLFRKPAIILPRI